MFIPSAIALGAGQYVDQLLPGVNPNLVGVVIIVIATLFAVFHIRWNAIVTGFFLVLELIAVAVVTILGVTHVNQPLSILTNPQTFAAGGAATPISLGVILAGVTIGLFSYNGYAAAIVFSEETAGARRNVAHAVIWSLVITVAAELIPVTAALLGAPSLSDLSTASSPMSYFITALAGDTVNKLVSLIVVLAIFNGTIAIMLTFGRILYSSARDKAWPDFVNDWLGRISQQNKSPWVATVLIGLLGAVLTAFSNVAALVTFIGVTLCLTYFLVAVSALVSRFTQPDLERPWRMPLWPLPPLVAIVGIVIAFSQQSISDILLVAAFVVVALVYYAIYLRPRADRWVILQPVTSGEMLGAEEATAPRVVAPENR